MQVQWVCFGLWTGSHDYGKDSAWRYRRLSGRKAVGCRSAGFIVISTGKALWWGGMKFRLFDPKIGVPV
jgi:hypothetical protein